MVFISSKIFWVNIGMRNHPYFSPICRKRDVENREDFFLSNSVIKHKVMLSSKDNQIFFD